MANRTMEHETWAERGAICMSASPCPHSYTALTMPHGHRTLVNQHWMGIQWDSKWGCGQVCFVYAWVSGDPDTLGRPCLQFKSEFASTVKKRDDILRNTNYWVALSYPFLLTSLTCISQPFMLKMMTQKERERQGNPECLFLSACPWSSVGQREWVLVESICVCQEM